MLLLTAADHDEAEHDEAERERRPRRLVRGAAATAVRLRETDRVGRGFDALEAGRARVGDADHARLRADRIALEVGVAAETAEAGLRERARLTDLDGRWIPEAL